MHAEIIDQTPHLVSSVSFVDIDIESKYATSVAIHFWLSTVESLIPVEVVFSADSVDLYRTPILDGTPVDERWQFTVYTRISRFIVPINGTFRVDIHLVASDGGTSSLHIANVHLGNWSGAPHLPSRYMPILLLSQGRTGSTAVMSALSKHPHIAVPGQYPFEFRQASYLVHALNVLTAPAKHESSFSPDSFETASPERVGYNPYLHRTLASTHLGGATLRWQDSKWPSSLAAFIVKSIDDYVDTFAGGREGGKLFFAEKVNFSTLQNVYSHLYGTALRIILIRDFRDVYISARDFNRARGRLSFGRELFASDLDWLRSMAHGAKTVAQHCASLPPGGAILRYEDLITDPRRAVSRMFKALGLHCSDPLLDVVLSALQDDTGRPGTHATSDSAALSVGRWRTELTDEEKDVAEEALGESLSALGYDL